MYVAKAHLKTGPARHKKSAHKTIKVTLTCKKYCMFIALCTIVAKVIVYYSLWVVYKLMSHPGF